jgi:integrase
MARLRPLIGPRLRSTGSPVTLSAEILGDALSHCYIRLLVLSAAAAEGGMGEEPCPSGTGRPVQFEITRQTRAAVGVWITRRGLTERDYLFPSRVRAKPHMSTRQYGRIVDKWVSSIGLDPKRYGTHSMRRTKASQIYKKTGNIRAVQLLLGHTKLESTVRYLGIEVDDAMAISEQVEL